MQLHDIITPLSAMTEEEQRALIRKIQENRRAIPKLVQEKIERKEQKEEDAFLALLKKSKLTVADLKA